MQHAHRDVHDRNVSQRHGGQYHELARVKSLLRPVSAGAPGHGSNHLLLSSAMSLGFSWDSDSCVWLRPGLPALCQVSSPFQFFSGDCLGRMEN